MANTVFKLRRSSVAGKYPNTSTLSIAELAINLTDRKLFSSDGANVFVLGSNLEVLHVQTHAVIHGANLIGNTATHNTATFFGNVVLNGGLSAAGSYGNSGLFLTSNGSAVFWASTTTDVNIPHIVKTATGNGVRTSFAITGGYDANYLNVYLNGVKMTDAEANTASGANVEFAVAPVSNSKIDFIGYELDASDGVYVKQSYIGNGSNTSFVVANGYTSNALNVYLNGVRATGTEVNTASGANIVFAVAPANGTNIDVFGVKNLNPEANFVIESFIGDGATDTFSTTLPYNPERLNVYLNGVRMSSDDVSIINGVDIVFVVPPVLNSVIDVYGIYVPSTSAVNTADTYTWTNNHYWGSTTSGAAVNSSVISLGNSSVNVFINSSSIYVGGVAIGGNIVATINTSARYTWTNTQTFTNTITFSQTINATSNSALFIGSLPAANVVSNAQLSSNLANYQTSAGLSANVAKLTANNTSFVGTVAAANVVSNAQLQGNVTTLQTYADNKAANAYSNAVSDASTDATNKAANAYSNAVSYTDAKAGNAYSNAVIFASNASNINTGTLAEARLPYRMDQNLTTTNNVIFGNLTLTGNLNIGSNVNVIGANNLSIIDNMIYLNANNTVDNPDLGFAGNYNDGTYHHTGFFRDASDGYWKVFDNYLPEPDANVYIDTTNTSFHLANFQANVIAVGNTSVYSTINTTSFTGTANNTLFVGTVAAANIVSNAQLSSNLANYQTTAGLSGNVATLTANNTSFVGSVSAANVVSNAQLSSNLSNYQTTAGLSSNVATLTSNNTSFVGSVSAANVVSNAQLSANLSSYLPLAGSSMTGTIIGRPNGGGSVGISNDSGALSVRSNTSSDSATISFHRPGQYAINMGLDTDNIFKIGGWSDGSGVYRAEIAAPGGTSIVNSSLNVVGSISNRYGSLSIPGTSLYSVPPGKTKAIFICTGAQQSFVVPAGVTAIYVKMWGAGGGGGVSGGWGYGSDGGGGGCSIGLIPVTAGETLQIVVGRGGQTNWPNGQTLVYGGGGGLKNNSDNRYAGAGGGYTGIFRTSVTQGNALMIAGGGGGGGSSRAGAGNFGGAGGGLEGQRGGSSYDGKYTYGGGGGTQSDGGRSPSQAGGALYGGYGGEPGKGYGGGGGGGYWGGGGGAYSESNTMAGGGGGSGYLGASVLYGKTFSGFRARPGMYDDPDLPKSIDGYDYWTTFASGGPYVMTGGQYTSAGGGCGYMVIYY